MLFAGFSGSIIIFSSGASFTFFDISPEISIAKKGAFQALSVGIRRAEVFPIPLPPNIAMCPSFVFSRYTLFFLRKPKIKPCGESAFLRPLPNIVFLAPVSFPAILLIGLPLSLR